MTIKGKNAVKAVKKIISEEIDNFLAEDSEDVKATPKSSDPTKYSSDSIDSAIDAYLIDKLNEDPDSIAENIANLVHNFSNLIDYEGMIIRRCLNSVTEKAPNLKSDVLQTLRSNFDLDVDGAIDAESDFDQADVPVGKNGSPALAQ